MASLLKNTVIYTIGRVFPQAAGFILLSVYTSYLSPEQYGIVESMLVLGMVLGIFFSMATERSMFRLYYDYKSIEEKKIFVGNVTFMIVIFSLLTITIILLCKGLISKIYKGIEFYPYYMYVIGSSFAVAFSFVPQTIFQVKEKPGYFILFTILSFVLNSLFILFFVIERKEGATGYLKGKMISDLIVLPISLFICYKQSAFKIKGEVIRNILSFSIPMIPTLLTAWILNMSNRIFIEQYFSLKEVGIFSISYKIANLATIVLAALFTAYNPLFYRLANNNELGKIKEINKGLIIVMFAVCFTIAFLSKEVIVVFLNSNFHVAYFYVAILVSSVLFVQLGGLFNVMIYQNKKPVQIMFISIIGAFFNVAINFILVPRYSLVGAAIASGVSAFFIYVLKYIVAKRNYYIKTPFSIIVIATITCAIILLVDIKLININIYYSLIIKTSLLLLGLFFLYSKNKERIRLFTKTV